MDFRQQKRTAQENAARNKTERKHSEDIKGMKLKYADERKNMGRFAKRFSGERPISLGFELTFLSEFKRVVWRVLDPHREAVRLYKSSTHQRAFFENLSIHLPKLLILTCNYSILIIPNNHYSSN